MYVRQVLRRAGLSDSAVGTPQTIYRYSGPDNVLTYGNVPHGDARYGSQR